MLFINDGTKILVGKTFLYELPEVRILKSQIWLDSNYNKDWRHLSKWTKNVFIKIKQCYACVERTEFVSVITVVELIYSFPTLKQYQVSMAKLVVQLTWKYIPQHIPTDICSMSSATASSFSWSWLTVSAKPIIKGKHKNNNDDDNNNKFIILPGILH